MIATKDAETLLDECEVRGVTVLGIEGLRLQVGATVPDMNAIADFSYVSSSSASIVAARRFVRTLGTSDLFLDFVLRHPPD